MISYFVIFFDFCQRNKNCTHLFLLDTVGAKLTIETAKQAIDTANDGLNLYNKVLDQSVPTKSFKESIEKLHSLHDEYSRESAELVSNIKTKLVGVIDEYDSAIQGIYEWCGTMKPVLGTYISLFNEGSASKQTMQKKFIVQLLETQKQKIENTQIHLGDCVENLDSVSKYLTSLKFHLNKDFDENGEYFQCTIKQSLRESHDPTTTSFKWASCFGKGSSNIDSMEEKLIRELKEKLRAVREFYENLKVQVDQAIIDVKQTQEKLTNQMKVNDELKARVSETKMYAVNGDIIGLQNSVIGSANNLIAHCDEYRYNHPI